MNTTEQNTTHSGIGEHATSRAGSRANPKNKKRHVKHNVHTAAVTEGYANWLYLLLIDQGYGRGGTPVFPGVVEPLAPVTLYLTEENGLDSCFGAA